MLLLLAAIVVLAVAGVSLQRFGWDEALAWTALATTLGVIALRVPINIHLMQLLALVTAAGVAFRAGLAGARMFR